MKNIFVLSVLLALGACATQRVHMGDNMSMTAMPSYEKSQPFFLGGIGQTTDVSAREICGSKKVSRVDSSFTPVDVILNMVTFGIYSPRSIMVYCEK